MFLPFLYNVNLVTGCGENLGYGCKQNITGEKRGLGDGEDELCVCKSTVLAQGKDAKSQGRVVRWNPCLN